MAKYTDIDLSFSRNPVTNDVSILNDAASVKAAIKNLVLTDLGERPFRPDLGSTIRGILFEPVSPITASEIEARVMTVLRNYEPRCTILGVKVVPKIDENAFDITIGFKLLNDTRITLVPITLKRLR